MGIGEMWETKPIARIMVTINDCVDIEVEGCDELIKKVLETLITNRILVPVSSVKSEDD